MKSKLIAILSVLFLLTSSVSAFAAVSIAPSAPLSDQNLVCSNGGNANAYLYQWFQNGAQKSYTSNSIPNSATTHFDTWTCKMFMPPNAFTGTVLLGQSTVTIQNAPPTVNANGPYAGIEGITNVAFTGTAVDNIDNDAISSYAWNFGDTNTANIQNPTHLYAQNGTYNVSLTATDAYGASATAMTTAVIGDQTPVSNFGISANPVNEGVAVTLTDASTSYDPIVAWNWDIDNDGTIDYTVQNPTHTYLDNGTYTINLSVTDNDGSVNSSIQTITVNDLAPTASFTQNLAVINEGQSVVFTDTSVSAPDLLVAWNWDFGDGNTATTQNPTHQYLDNGTYTVTLTVTDDDGSTNTTTSSVTVNDLSPISSFTQSANTINEGQSVTFTDASTSFPDLIVSWSWDFGDSSPLDTTQNPTHTYMSNGVYTVSLTVTDDDGSTNISTSTITVNDLAPAANFSASATTVLVNDPINFTDLSTSFPDSIVAWNWDMDNDGVIDYVTQNVTSHSYAVAGTYTVNLSVTDSDGSINSTLQTITVNAAPVINTILVNEFEQNPVAGSEWVELYNPNAFAVDISGWQIWDGLASPTLRHTVPASTILAANGYYVANVINLNNAGEFVTLYDNNSNLIDQTPTLAESVSSNNCQARMPNGVDTNTPADWTFQTCTQGISNSIVPPDTTAPATITSLSATGITNQSITWNWINPVNVDFNGTIIFINGVNVVNLTAVDTSYTASGLTNNTLYTIGVQTFDTSNNVNATTITNAQTTLQNNDVTAPAISNIQVVNFTNSTATINWTTDESANSTVNYGLTSALGTFQNDSSYVFNHSIMLVNLAANTLYNFNVTSCDGSNNCATAGTLTFTTAANPGIPSVFNILNSTINGIYFPSNISTDVTSVAIDNLSTVTNSPQVDVSISMTNSTILRSTITNAATIVNCVIIDTAYDGSCLNEYWDPSTKINSTTTGSNVTDSNVKNSIATYSRIIRSNLTSVNMNNTNVTDNTIDNSNVSGSSITLSTVNGSTVMTSTITSSTVTGSNATNAVVTDSTVSGSTVTDSNVTTGSVVSNSTITAGSVITNSNITNSNLINTTVTDSTLTNVNATNSNVMNTTLSNMILTNATIVNGNLTSGTITLPNGVNVTGPAQVPYPPVAGFNYNTNYLDVSFSDASSDPNSDIVSRSWNFGDGSPIDTSTNPSHTYTSANTYSVTYTVTDSTNLVSSISRSVTVSSATASNPGGSSRGSFITSDATPTLDQTLLVNSNNYLWNVAENPWTKTIRRIDTIMFEYQGTSYSLVIDDVKKDSNQVTMRISPTDEIRTGYKYDTFEFTIKDRILSVSLQDIIYNSNIDSQTQLKLKLTLKEPKAGASIPVTESIKDGVIKVMGEIAPPPNASVPVGIGVSAATLVAGLLLFLGIRKIWV